MIKKFVLPLTACLLAAGSQAPLKADDTEQQLGLLYQKLNLVLGGTQVDKNSELILASPGIPLGKDFNPDTDDDDADLLMEQADVIPKANQFFVECKGYTYSRLYQQIIENKQSLPNPPDPPDPRDDAALKAAQAKVADGSDLRTQFDAANDDYQTKLADWVNSDATAKAMKMYAAAVAQLPMPTDPDARLKHLQDLRDAMTAKANAESASRSAQSAYTLAFNKLAGPQNLLKVAFNTIQEITSKSGGAWWTSVRDRFHAAEKSADHYTVSFFPPASGWNTPSNDWTKFTYKTGEKVTSTSSQTSAINAAIGYHKGTTNADGSFSKDDFNADAMMAAKDFTCTFEIKRVNIYRRWWDPDVFTNQNWFLPKAVGNHSTMLSYGDFKTNRDKDPALPVYVTAFYLIRNLEMTSSYISEHSSEFSHAMGMDAKVEVGPFSVSGGYHTKKTGTNSDNKINGNSISCPGIQIIGYMAACMPACPNPNPSLRGAPKS